MKNLKKISLILGFALLFFACETEERGPVVGVFTPPSLSSPAGGGSFVLTEATENDVMTKFTWTEADFGFQSATSYTVMMDFADNDFTVPFIIGTTTGLELQVLNGAVNNKLMTAGAIAGRATDFEVRIRATIHRDVDTLFSTGITLTITPFEKIIVYPKLYVPGNYQAAWNPAWSDWTPANDNTCIFSVKLDDKYEGYVWFANASSQYKFTQGPSWDVNWGDDGADGTLDPVGANIVSGDPGYYKLNVDLAALKHTATKTDWGLIGSGTPGGWDSDQDMTYEPLNDIWTITLNLVAGDIKFRANDDWAINLGDDNADEKLEYGGANIAVAEAGNYTITLNLSEAIYRYKVVKN